MYLPTIYAVILIVGMIWSSVLGTFADDSTARFGAGGIEFLKSDDIRMVEEVLEVSTKAVRVRFCFLNQSDRDICTTVAFPLPPYPPFFANGPSGVSNPASIMEAFKVQVAGRQVPTQYDRKAVVAGVDVTDQLRASGLSEGQIFDDVDIREDQEITASAPGRDRMRELLSS
ncbi:MAG: DUF4424 family protein, partial [Pseudomonadota bacterium]